MAIVFTEGFDVYNGITDPLVEITGMFVEILHNDVGPRRIEIINC